MIPVVLIHQGQSSRYPLDAVMQHDIRFGNSVCLITDQGGFPKLSDYWTRAEKLAEHYVHLSGNHAEFELFCLQRWYVLAEWMHAHGHHRVLYTDSDVLLFCNAESEWETWAMQPPELIGQMNEGTALATQEWQQAPYAFTLALGSSAATSYWTLSGLQAFLDYVDSIYIGRNAVFTEFERIFREMQAQGLPGGISDMACLKFFKEQVKHVRVGEMTEIKGGATWDHNLNASDGYAMLDGHKQIQFRDGLPFGLWLDAANQVTHPVRFNALHFQGQAKARLKEYLL